MCGDSIATRVERTIKLVLILAAALYFARMSIHETRLAQAAQYRHEQRMNNK